MVAEGAGAASVAAVMYNKVPVKGSITQSQLKAKLTQRKADYEAAGNTAAAEKIDVNRELMASDLATSDLTAEPLDSASSLYGNPAAFAAGTSADAVADTAEHLGLALNVTHY